MAEVLEAEATHLLEPPVTLRYRHIGFDIVVLARLQFGAAVIALIGQCLQGLGFKDIFCRFCHRMKLADIAAVGRFCHRMKLADIAAVVHHVACDNEIMLVVDGGLHIVACDALTVLD